MDSITKVYFTVKALGFPIGKIHRMSVWLENIKNPGKWVDDNSDKIKEELKSTCIVHSIQHTSTTWTNMPLPEGVNFGDIILDSSQDVTLTNKSKEKKKKKNKESKPVTDIRKLDLPNIDKDDLNTLKNKIDIELFKRENELSDKVYDFYLANIDLVTVEEAKKVCEEYGTDDKFILRKKEVRKKVEEKISTT